MAVYVAAHKAYPVRPTAGYIPLQVGAACHEPLPYTRDDTGENISAKNPHYCELTGLYWIWKNTRDDYKGMIHYRRYFTAWGKPLSEAAIRRRLEKHAVIVPRPEYLRETAWEEFCLHSGREKDLRSLRRAVEAVDPEALIAFDRVMQDNRLCLYNMLIARREVFDDYCRWLFAVLEALEPSVDMTGYTDYEQRLYGFLGERLLNVWLIRTGTDVCPTRVTNTEKSLPDKCRLSLRRVKNRLLFALRRRNPA